MYDSSRVYLWDNLKFWLMILVLITHSFVNYMSYDKSGLVFLLLGSLCMIRMPLFTIISGYWYKEKDFKTNALRLLYPCLLFSLVEFIEGRIFCGPSYPWNCFGFSMWYMFVLFIYSIITPFLTKYVSLKFLIPISFIVSWIIGFVPCVGYEYSLSRLFCFYPFFLIGLVLRKVEILNRFENKIVWYIILFSTLIIGMVLMYRYSDFYLYQKFAKGYDSFGGLIRRVMMQVLCVGASVALLKVFPRDKRWYSLYGTRTLNVYMLHMSIIFPLIYGVSSYYNLGRFDFVFCLICVPLLCVILFSKIIDDIMKSVLLKNKL
ncbi:MAG: acyltransferase family protein [Paludibacteraceae bacterium]|nr:acyltransferase family protein [Paludibacteraceae bacterium]